MRPTCTPARHRPFPLGKSIASLILGTSLSLSSGVRAAEFQWDANPATPGVAEDGSGTWNSASNNWISEGANTSWLNDPASDAIFGAGVDATTPFLIDVDLGGFGTADSLIFNNSGYVLSAEELQTITLGNATASISIAAGKTATIGANVTLTGLASPQNTTVTGGGTLILENGGTLLNSGSTNSTILQLNTTVEVREGGSIRTLPNGNAIFINAAVNVVGGDVNAIGTLGIGSQNTTGVGNLTISSGTVTALSANGVRFGGGGATAGGTINLDGGLLNARFVQKGAGAVTSILNFNGGTLKATSESPTGFLSGLGRANVRDGGAIIDSNGRAITIGQALEHSNILDDAATDGGLIKQGNGTLTLTGANTYTGGTTINGGNLRFEAGAVPATGSITVNDGGGLVAAGAFTTATEWLASGKIATGSTGALTLAGHSDEDINLSGYASLRLGTSVNANYTGTLTPAGDTYRLGGGGAALKLIDANTLTGARNLSVSGPGSVIIANTNDFTGTTTIESGTLQLGDGVTQGELVNTSSVVNSSAFTIFVATSQTFSGAISGTGIFTKQGAGTLTLSGNNSYSGPTAFNNGVLNLAHSNALGTSSLTINAGTLQLQLSGGITVNNTIRAQGSGLGQDGIIKNLSGTNTLTDFGFYTLGGTRLHVLAGSTLNLPNSIAVDPAGGPQSFRIVGGGTIGLGGDNTAAINAVSSFLLGSGNAAGPIVSVGNDLAFGEGTLDFQPLADSTVKSSDATARTIANSLKFSGSGVNEVTFGAAATGDLTFTGPASLNGDLAVAVENASTTLSGSISGSHEVIKSGPGTLVLAGLEENSYSGGTTVASGLLTVQKDGGLGSGDVSLLSGGSLKLELGTTNNYISDTGSLLLAGTSTPVALNFTGAADTIAGLSFDGGNTFVEHGIWGSLTSGAEFKSAAFTGTGTLHVVPEPATAASLLGALGLLMGMRRRRAA